MAERIQVELVDDIDGSRAQQTVTFALDGVTYEIDLSDGNARSLRALLEPYVARARTAAGKQRTTRKQEREERRTRQANKQLTEQIRGAAQRSRELRKQQKEAAEAEVPREQPDTVEEEPLQLASQATSELDVYTEPDEKSDKPRASTVSLPQFSAATD